MFSNSLKKSSLALAMGLALASSTAYAGGDRLECGADSERGDSSIDARFESETKEGVLREKFSASFEEAPDGVHEDGDVLHVYVAAKKVGTITLAVQPNGDLGGDLDFDTNIDKDDPNDDTEEFPDNWPRVDKNGGTLVKVSTRECDLQPR